MASFRLAIVTPRFWPLLDDRSTHLLRLAEALVRAEQKVTVVTPRWKKSWPTQMMVGPVPLVRLPGDGAGSLGMFRWMYSLVRWLRLHPQDVVLIAGLQQEAYAVLRSPPVESTVVLLAGDDCLSWQQNSLLGSRAAAACRKTRLIIAPSGPIAVDLAAAGYSSEQIAVVPRGAQVACELDAEVRQTARLSLAAVNYDLIVTEKGCVALAIGRLDERHRFSDLVRAWRIVTARRSDTRLWMVGDGPHRERLYQQIGDLDQRFRAFLPGTFEGNAELLAACDVLLVPGDHPTPPIAMLDALATGVPVVAADGPGAQACLRDGHQILVYPVGDFKALAAATLTSLERTASFSVNPGRAARSPGPCTQTPDSEAAEYLDRFQHLRAKNL